MLITLLMIYLFIGFFGGNYGLKTSIAEDILGINKPSASTFDPLPGILPEPACKQ